jgi:tellurite resistance protein
LIIVGEMNLTFKKRSGEFYCPSCEQPRVYVQKRVKRFLTLYFIPLIPLDTVNEFVECQNCRGSFTADSLDMRPEDYQRAARRMMADDVRRVMVLTMLADDVAEPAEIDVIRSTYRQLAERELTDAELKRDLVQARQAKVTAATYAAAIASRRSPAEKDLILRSAFLVASATGDLSDERKEQLKQLPIALGVSEEHFRQIIAQT